MPAPLVASTLYVYWVLMNPDPAYGLFLIVHVAGCRLAMRAERVGWKLLTHVGHDPYAIQAKVIDECRAIGLEVGPHHIGLCVCCVGSPPD